MVLCKNILISFNSFTILHSNNSLDPHTLSLSHTHRPVEWWPSSAAEVCAGTGSAAGLLSAASGAAAELRTCDAGTELPCSEVCGWCAGSPVWS